MSTVVAISQLPPNCEPFYILNAVHGLDPDTIEDIYTPPGGCTHARVVFKTHEVAKRFAHEFNGFHFGRTGQKMITRLCEGPVNKLLEGFTNRLSEFLHARDNQILSRTVKITGLPRNHTLSNLNQLLDPVEEKNETIISLGHNLDPSDYFYSEPCTILHSKCPEPGVGLVRLEDRDMAIELVNKFAGTYWKNATLNARCVPDEEMEGLLVQTDRGEKHVMLFVAGIKADTSSAEVQEMFKDYPVRDVNLPPGGKTFCFVFFRQSDANAVLAQFGKGFQWKGRTIRVSVSDKDKKKNTKSAFGASSAAPTVTPTPIPTDTTDLKLNNLPYGVADSNIRIFFQGFTVSKVIVKQGYAFIGIAANQVDRAIDELNGKMIGDRKVFVKVSERRKQ